MLRFSTTQAQLVLNNRLAFNRAQEAMAQTHGDLLRGNAAIGNALPLPRDVWGLWDEEGVTVQRDVLTVFNDLAASTASPIPIGKLVAFFKTISDSGEAAISLDGRHQDRLDKPEFNYHGTPVPIISEGFGFGWREVEAARTEGMPLDGDARENSQRKVAEKGEDIALNGDASIVVGGDQLYGLRTHPNRNTRSTGVTLNSASGAEWLAEINATLKLLHGDNFKSPATIYLNWDDWFYAASTEFTSGYPKTIAQRVREMEGVRDIVPGDRVPANEVIALIKDRRVVRVLNGMPMSTQAMFRANPTDDYSFMTMMAASLQVRFDAEGNCGVAHSA